jgi:hypothetical protein
MMVYNTWDYWVFNYVQRPVFWRTQRFRNWICFHPQVRGWETPTLWGPLERAKLNHWKLTVLSYSRNSQSLLKCNYHVHKRLPLTPFLTQISPVNTQQHIFFRSISILFQHLCLSQPKGFLTKMLCAFLNSALHVQRISSLFIWLS